MPRAPQGALGLLTKKEKAWFFLLCGYQSKINKLIFLVFLDIAFCQLGNVIRFMIDFKGAARRPCYFRGTSCAGSAAPRYRRWNRSLPAPAAYPSGADARRA
ncbi:hypothetical protein DMW62_16035 [Serratia marcescens]|uniref:Uncharacterized protein n=1 Tax=Serratia marcescens TaxID=615 RepID=A0ABX5NB07_SERMA|nr:hypothetical protein CW300_08120 [Serratia marcescens]PYA17055.1 hypothetical protein DMW42_05735 [Serratia marcescens]PYA27162.1 hypothetical protein DMW41_04570 [Serratia marcescens]PYA30036.1 hypothetical protein DMW40_06695 [Serratia marcescens]PYA34961.1 hypothetical protein DMW50_16165 [Serratia marcescens]